MIAERREAILIRGVDVSMTEELESLGCRYHDESGEEWDLFEFAAVRGATHVRLRLWVDPHDSAGAPFLGGTNDLDRTVRMARRARSNGLGVILDLHYSDFWTDPKKQMVPRAWSGLSGKALQRQVGEYTASVLDRFASEEVAVDYVQVGNEITNGMLWPEGETPHYLWDERRFDRMGRDDALWASSFDRLADLLRAGASAVRRVSPSSRVILHLDFGGAADLYRSWFDEITARSVPFDVIGLSYYPMWHGTLADLERNLHGLARRYDKDVCVLETAYGWALATPDGAAPIFDVDAERVGGYPATPEGQLAFLSDLREVVEGVPGGHGLGFVYWEPGWVAIDGTSWASKAGMDYGNDHAEEANNWSNLALFDASHRALPGWQALGPT